MSDNSETPNADPKKGKSKVFILMGIILVAEAAVIVGGMKFLAGPSEVQAGAMPDIEMTQDEKIVETLVLSGKMPNSRTGVTYLYDTEIFLQAKNKYTDQVNMELEQFQNEMKADITAIWRTSDPHHFEEPRLETLTRKIYALLSDRFGLDPVTSEPIVQKIVIVMQTGFRIDN
jgi:hypothetical protein